MAKRALSFGARFKSGSRTVSIRRDSRRRDGYEVEVERRGRRAQRRQHPELAGALRDFAASWRSRLH